jgi:hypothetical protein
MTQSKIRNIVGACYGPTWRLAAAAGAFYLARHDGPAPLGLSELWYFLSAYLTLWAINVATQIRIVQKIAHLLMTTTVTLAYGYLAVGMHFWLMWVAAGLAIAVFAADLWFDRGPTRLLNWLLNRTGINLPPMPEDDARFWAECTNVRDFGRVNALYLHGLIGSQPGYAASHGVDEETAELVPVLAAANLAGFYTTSSQPGCHDGFEQNAYVVGYADYATMTRLLSLLTDSGLNYRIAHTTSRRDFADAGRIRWGIQTAGDVESDVEEVCNPVGIQALLGSYQIVIEDPEAGRDDQLWWRLALFAFERGYLVGDDTPNSNELENVQLYTRSHALPGEDITEGMWLATPDHTGACRIVKIRAGEIPDARVASISGLNPDEDRVLLDDREYIVVDPTSAIAPFHLTRATA